MFAVLLVRHNRTIFDSSTVRDKIILASQAILFSVCRMYCWSSFDIGMWDMFLGNNFKKFRTCYVGFVNEIALRPMIGGN